MSAQVAAPIAELAPAPPMLECRGLSKVYCRGFEQGRRYAFVDILRPGRRPIDRLRREEFLAVDRFSVTVRKGENVLVLGLPGAGKTTIAKLLTGMLLADAGDVQFRGPIPGRTIDSINLRSQFKPSLLLIKTVSEVPFQGESSLGLRSGENLRGKAR